MEISSILASEGFSELAGEMMRYALAVPQKLWGDDTKSEEWTEPGSQVDRAIEYLRFQLVLPEIQIREAEKIAAAINGPGTQFMFVRSDTSDAGGEHAEIFSYDDQKELWTASHRDRLIRALDALMLRIAETQGEARASEW